jgi:type I restriction enzyme M protein
MLTGEFHSQINQIWNAFWSGGISNPLEIIEQTTYLLFLRRLDDFHTAEEREAQTLKQKRLDWRFFPEDKDERGMPYEDLCWSEFMNLGDPGLMYKVVDQQLPGGKSKPRIAQRWPKRIPFFATLQRHAFQGELCDER